MNKEPQTEIISAAALRAHVEQLDRDRANEHPRAAQKAEQYPPMFREEPTIDAELDARERGLIGRGLELALLGQRIDRLEQQLAANPRLSRRQRREIERAQRRLEKKRKRDREKLVDDAATFGE